MRLRRRIADLVALAFAGAATAFGLTWLIWILWTTLAQGAAALSPALVTQMTPPPGESGGLLNAFYGSAVMVFLALLIGTPVGVAAGTYLAEHGRHSRLAAAVGFINDILLSAPSIVIGLFVYELVVRPLGHFSGFAGAIALAGALTYSNSVANPFIFADDLSFVRSRAVQDGPQTARRRLSRPLERQRP